MTQKTKGRASVSSKRLSAVDVNIAPWPEWDDGLVNTTVWDPNREGFSPGISISRASTRTSVRKSVRQSTILNDIVDENKYEDGNSGQSSLAGCEVAKWERADKISGLEMKLVNDFNENSEVIDLVSNNQHLRKNKFMKEIIDNVSCLVIASSKRPFFAEFPSETFRPLTDIWKPWHHVYAFTRAGQGDGHTPMYNRYGMYYVRLYFLGKWRRIHVDDSFPLDDQGNLQLPVSSNRDLWFPILTKALIRVATACEEKNISIITALTGWIKSSSNIHGVATSEVWNVCCSHLLKENELVPPFGDDIHCSYYGGFCSNDMRHLKISNNQTVFIFANIIELIYNLEDVEPQKKDLFVYINQVTHDWIKTKDYPRWKEYRWFDWAYKHNIINGKIGQTFKYLEVYSPEWKALFNSILNENKQLESDFFHSENSGDGFRDYEFGKFIKFIQSMDMYYLPSQFESTLRSDNLTSLEMFKSKEQPKGKEVKNKIEVISRFNDPSCETFYLLVDSPYCKRVYLDCTFFKDFEDSKGHIICEKYYWSCDVPRSPEFSIKTNGSATKVITAGPGRCAYKIFCRLPDVYFIQIFSNTPFLLVSKESLQEIFQEDSVSYKIYANQIAERFTFLVNSEYATNEHTLALNYFFESFYPTDLRQKSSLHQSLMYRIPFDKLLEETIIDFILQSDLANSSENLVNVLEKFKKLFLNPGFAEEIISQHKALMVVPTEESSTSKSKTTKPTSKPKPTPISDEMFFDKPLNNIKILKMMMSKEKSFLELYPFCFDNETKLIIHEYKGKVELQTNHPVTIGARLIVNIHSLDLVPCGIIITIPHEFNRVCIYDIETMNLIPVKFDSNSIWMLSKSEKGFVVFILCYNTGGKKDIKAKPGDLQWKMRLLAQDENCLLHPCKLDSGIICNLKPPNLPTFAAETIKGYYLPNPQNIITKFLITINQNDVVTLQLTVNCSTAIMSVELRDGYGEIVKVCEGREFVFLPALLLKLEDIVKDETVDNGLPFFTGIIRLKYNSWELSESDLNFIEETKENYIPFSDIIAGAKSKRKKSTEVIENIGPTWILSLTTENAQGKLTKLLPDTREYDQFKISNPTSKEQANDERCKKADELRSNFQIILNEMREGIQESIVMEEELKGDQMSDFLGDEEETKMEEEIVRVRLTKSQVFHSLLDKYK